MVTIHGSMLPLTWVSFGEHGDVHRLVGTDSCAVVDRDGPLLRAVTMTESMTLAVAAGVNPGDEPGSRVMG